MSLIRIRAGEVEMLAELNETESARRMLDVLPFKSRAETWGEEVYFETPLELGEEDPKAHVPPGTVAYWPSGKALCLFFGQTPASPVNVVGRLRGNPKELARVRAGDPVSVERHEE